MNLAELRQLAYHQPRLMDLINEFESLHAAAVRLAPHRIVNGLYGSKLCLECLQHSGAAELIPHAPDCPAGLVLGMDGGK